LLTRLYLLVAMRTARYKSNSSARRDPSIPLSWTKEAALLVEFRRRSSRHTSNAIEHAAGGR
jgi:hypothetical protein